MGKKTCQKCGYGEIGWLFIPHHKAGLYKCRGQVRCRMYEQEHHHIQCRRCQHVWAITVEDALQGGE